MNPAILPSTIGKWKGRLGSLTFAWQPVQEKENSEFTHRLKIDLVLHPA